MPGMGDPMAGPAARKMSATSRSGRTGSPTPNFTPYLLSVLDGLGDGQIAFRLGLDERE